MQVLARWHDIVRSGDPSGLAEILAEDCVFWSPVVHRPQAGRDLTQLYLTGAMSVFNDNGASEWSVLASYYHQFTETFGASVGFQYFSDFYLPSSSVGTGLDGYGAELNLVWTPIENLEVRSEIYYDDYETLDGTASGFLRLTRFF